MTVFVQRVDEATWMRDAPRSLGDAVHGLRGFRLDELASDLPGLAASELAPLRAAVVAAGSAGLQVWGLPAVHEGPPPAARDVLLLREDALVRYAGRVLRVVPGPCPGLSRRLWGGVRFGTVVLLAGRLARYPWARLADELGFDADDPLREHGTRLTPARLALSRFRSSSRLLDALATGGLMEAPARVLGFAEAADPFGAEPEGFDEAVMQRQGARCAACGLDVPTALEVARLIPLAEDGSDDPGNGLVLCATHHAMFEAGLFAVRPDDLALVPAAPHTAEGLRITETALDPLAPPHAEALAWRWERARRDGRAL